MIRHRAHRHDSSAIGQFVNGDIAFMNEKPSKYDRALYCLVMSYRFLSRIFPIRIWLFAGKCLGFLSYLADSRHRKIILANLRFAYGSEKGEKEIRSLARRIYMQFGMTGHEWIRLKDISPEELSDFVHVEGKEHLISAKKKNRSVILLSAHFGNWEYAHLFYANTINKLTFIVRKIDNPLLEKERIAYNQRAGINIVYKENGLREAIRNLKRGMDLVIFADQNVNLREGIPCYFFGKKASTISLVPALAKKFHVPVVPMFTVRCRDKLHHRIIFLPELEFGPDKSEGGILKSTQLQNNAIEQAVRMHPDHWLWFHRKWKCYYPEIYKF